MPAVTVRFDGCIREPRGHLAHGVKQSIERLLMYGYTVQVEIDRLTELNTAHAFLAEHGIPVVGILLRGQCGLVPELVFDNRCPTWQGWRTAMLTVDEKHRNEYREWVKTH